MVRLVVYSVCLLAVCLFAICAAVVVLALTFGLSHPKQPFPPQWEPDLPAVS